MATFYIKQNDTGPSIEAVLTDSNGKYKSLTDVATVKFNMADENGNVIIDKGTCGIVNASKGIVFYGWQTGDTANTGTYNAEFQVEYTNGQIETFPNSSYIKVVVKGELA